MSSFLAELSQSSWVSTWVAPVFLLGFLIFVHEFGHFLFAKIFKVPVEQFSFGFGPRIAGVMYKGTDYRLNLIPLGGYVKMLGDDPFEPEDMMRPDGYLAQAAWKRLFIVAAGPVFNLVLPIFLFAAVYMAGAPQPTAWVGYIAPGSPAHAAGLLEGDRIVTVDGEEVGFWSQVQTRLDEAAAAGEPLRLVVRRAGNETEIALPAPAKAQADGDISHGLGLDNAAALPVVSVLPGSAAESAGLVSGDHITALDGAPISWWFEAMTRFEQAGDVAVTVTRPAAAGATEPELITVTLVDSAQALTWMDGRGRADWLGAEGTDQVSASDLRTAHPGLRYGLLARELTLSSVLEGKPARLAGVEAGDSVVGLTGRLIASWSEIVAGVSTSYDGPVSLVLLRGTSLFEVSVQPEVETYVNVEGRSVQTARIGIGSGAELGTDQAPMRLGVVTALAKGAGETWLVIATTVRVLGRIVTGDIPLAESIGGPIAIVKYAQVSASVSIFRYLKMMALISVSLGLMNLLPIPLLDGGHLLFFGVEAVRGRPVSLKFREISHQVGLIFLLTLIAFALINDTRLHILK